MRNNLVVLPDGDSPSPRIEVIRDSKKMRNVSAIEQAPQHKPLTQPSVKNTTAEWDNDSEEDDVLPDLMVKLTRNANVTRQSTSQSIVMRQYMQMMVSEHSVGSS